MGAIRDKGEKALAVDLQDGLISVAIGVAAQLSIENGRFVTIEEVMDVLEVWGCLNSLYCVIWYSHIYRDAIFVITALLNRTSNK